MQTMRTASISLSTRCLFMWQLLTITRPAEAAEARWEESHVLNEAKTKVVFRRISGATSRVLFS